MGDRSLQAQSTEQNNQLMESRKRNIDFIQERFKIKETVEGLHTMMKEVTSKEFSAENVNAACHCVSQLNKTIDTTINAVKFLHSQQR